jgi:hypothetical protein
MGVLQELTAEFPEIDAELIDVLLESTSGVVTEDIVSGLSELLPGEQLIPCKVLASGQLDMPHSVDYGARLLFVPQQDLDVDEKLIEVEALCDTSNALCCGENDFAASIARELPRICITDPGGSQTLRCCCFRFTQFGVFEIEVFRDNVTTNFGEQSTVTSSNQPSRPSESASSLSVPVLCVTATFKLAQDVSALLEEVHWGWTGELTAELEGALLELLVTASEDLRALAGQVGPLMRLFGLDDMDDTVAEVLSAAPALRCCAQQPRSTRPRRSTRAGDGGPSARPR